MSDKEIDEELTTEILKSHAEYIIYTTPRACGKSEMRLQLIGALYDAIECIKENKILRERVKELEENNG